MVSGRVDPDDGPTSGRECDREHPGAAPKIEHATGINSIDQTTVEPVVLATRVVAIVEVHKARLIESHGHHPVRTADTDKTRTSTNIDVGKGSSLVRGVDTGGLKPNTWQRFERLSSAWNQAKLVLGDQPDGAADDEPGVVANPRRRARTPLTESQVDAIRTARANGESVVSICRRFNVHRMTVWTHTRDLL